ncbi:MAG: OmpA family protein, partial [Polyangiaceae bacterium]
MKAHTVICLGISLAALTQVGCAESAPFGKSQPKLALVKPQSSEWDKPHDAKDEDGEPSAEDVGPNGVETPSLHISSAVAKACGITKTATSSSFDFDSVELSDADRGVLTEIAKCMTMGPMRGKQVSLIGRADPRGEDEFNMTLGSARAASVYEYLHDLG